MNDDLRNILEAANMAPSGENCQPWLFKIKGNEIELWNRPERDQSLYNWGQRASMMAVGAAFENFFIASSAQGYHAKVSLFPNPMEENLIAKIQLEKGNITPDPLNEYLFERSTNRKAYESKALSSQEIQTLKNSTAGNPAVRFFFTTNESDKALLGRAGSVNEEVMLNNPHLHQFFFSHINWNKKEDDEKKIGFFIDTLELPPPAIVGFKLFRSWKRARFLNKLGMNRMVAKQNGEVNAKAGGFGLLSIKDKSVLSFFEAGRALERIWLSATSLGLSLQPLTGVLFFMYRIEAGETDKFSPDQLKIVEDAHQCIRKIFDAPDNEVMAFMFRIGKSDKPTARSSRFKLEEVVELK